MKERKRMPFYETPCIVAVVRVAMTIGLEPGTVVVSKDTVDSLFRPCFELVRKFIMLSS